MKAAAAARALGINERTLKAWIDRPALSPFFSNGARKEANRDISEDDFIVLNTIRALREGVANNAVDWDEIVSKLDSGHRERAMPPQAAMVDSGLSVMAQHERMIVTMQERDAALRRASELQAERDELRAQLAEAMNRSAAERERLARELGRAEAELDLYRSGRLKPPE